METSAKWRSWDDALVLHHGWTRRFTFYLTPNVMLFPTDNSWPTGPLKIFESCRDLNKPLENPHYGPYDKLLNYCFGDSFTFFIAPQNPPGYGAARGAALSFSVVRDEARHPFLIAEIKGDSWAKHAGRRLEADQLRRRCDVMLDARLLPCLWGLSLLCPLPPSTYSLGATIAQGSVCQTYQILLPMGL
ncbi:hypothetical protein BDN67DRAFT_403386 [Paxillus ammoniavirescens]|nr:hypothetical protein BDN67DRAFT_403386 [Paxillus ammoniavirescens]